MKTPNNLRSKLFAGHDPEIFAILKQKTVAIAGAGGLGSNAAVALARAGVGKLIIADFDKIEPSNLNRQYYFISQIGLPKVKALADNLKKINPFSEYEIHHKKVTSSDVVKLFGKADLLIEAFDKAEEKVMLIRAWLALKPARPVISASGLAGYGKNNKLKTTKIGRLYICGDGTSEAVPPITPMSPKVAIVANLQANLALELLLK